MTLRSVLVSIGLLLVILSCSKRETQIAPNIATLIGTWQLTTPDSTYNVTLLFAYDDRNPPLDVTPFNASGTAAVNHYTVRLFATLDGMLSADNLGSTEMAGTPQAMQFEQAYFTNLNSVARFEVPNQDSLRLYHGGPTPGVLVYKRIK